MQILETRVTILEQENTALRKTVLTLLERETLHIDLTIKLTHYMNSVFALSAVAIALAVLAIIIP